MKSPMRITAVISSMQAGGAERVMAQLVNHWADAGWRVTVVTYEKTDAASFYPLHADIHYHPLVVAGPSVNIFDALFANFSRWRVLRRSLRQFRPHVVLSFCTEVNVIALLATRGLGIPVIVSERSNPRIQPKMLFWKIGRALFYPLSSKVIVQSEMAAKFFSDFLQPKVKIIPNALRRPETTHVQKANRILAVGRLGKEKGFDLLLQAFAQVHQAHPEWTLRIVGEGGERIALEGLALKLGVSQFVEFPGLCRNVDKEYAEAGIFVLSSRYEGFPNVLCEAMAAGLPVVAFECPGGVSEIIVNGRNGLLAELGNITSLARCMERLLDSRRLRVELGTEAILVMQRFAPEQILSQWTQCLESVVRTNLL
jgi:glycosyltransferase involved in cell wall biosynthesis